MRTLNRRGIALIGVIVVFLFLLVVFHRITAGGQTVIGGDLVYMNYPRMAFVGEELRAGRVPLWTPYSYGGYPLAAESQTGVFYPVNLALASVPKQFLPNTMYLLHLLMAGVFMYWLCLLLGMRPLGALAAAFSYSVNGFSLVHAHHLNIVYAMAWAPMMFALTELAVRRTGRRTLAFGLLGVCAALMFLGGHVQFFLYSAIAAAFYGLVRMIENRTSVLGTVAGALLTGAAAASLAAVQLLPTLELSKLSVRAAVPDYLNFTAGSLPLSMFGTLVSPHLFGAPWDSTYRGVVRPDEMYSFVCVTALVLAVVGAAGFIRNRKAVPFILLALAALLVALGGNLPLAKLLFHVPVLNAFRVPARAMMLFVFAASVLGGFGLDALLSGGEGKWGRRLYRLMFAGGIAMGIAAIAVFAVSGRIESALFSRTAAELARHSKEFYQLKVHLLLMMLLKDMAFLSVALLVPAVAARMRKGAKTASAAVGPVVLLLICIEATSLCGDFLNTADRSTLTYVPETAKHLRARKDFTRTYSHSTKDHIISGTPRDSMRADRDFWRRNMDTLDLEIPMLFRISSINGYGSLSLWNFQMMVKKRSNVGLFEDQGKHDVRDLAMSKNAEFPRENPDVLRRLKVTDVIAASRDGLKITDNRIGGTGKAVSPLWVRRGSNGVLADPIEGNNACKAKLFEVRQLDPSRIRVVIETKLRCDLILMQTYYPGIHVYEIKERRRLELKARDYWTGTEVSLTPGRHEILYSFEPELQTKAAQASLAGALLLMILSIFLIAKKPGRQVR